MIHRGLLVVVFSLAAGLSAAQSPGGTMEVPGSIEAEGVPPVPDSIDQAINRYRYSYSADFEGWVPASREILFRKFAPGGTLQIFHATPDQLARERARDRRTVLAENLRRTFPGAGQNPALAYTLLPLVNATADSEDPPGPTIFPSS